jgi:hypothetical protein
VKLTRRELASGLRARLAVDRDRAGIARWAFLVHLDARGFEPGVEGDLLTLIAMDMGPELELDDVALDPMAGDGG